MINRLMLIVGVLLLLCGRGIAADKLAEEFASPPVESRVWCYWWWLNGNASKEGITRDFEEMRKQGISGALLFDAGDAKEVARGPAFMSDEWRELYKHAVREADRYGIVLTVNLCSGWNAGGPWVTPEAAAKKLVSAETVVKGPGRVTVELSKPKVAQGYYRDITVLAYSVTNGALSNLTIRSSSAVIDLTGSVDTNGLLTWEAPAGDWNVLRIGYTLHGTKIQCVGSGPAGLEIDPMSAAAMDLHFAETGAKLISDAGPLVGKTLQYFHIDSWELGQPTWTLNMREEFQKRRGYDLLKWLPAVLGQTVDNAEETKRFVQDYRRTAADLVAANYYGRLEELSVKGGLRGSHPESGGPFFQHWIDPLECMGRTALPMGEFWKRNSEPNGPITWNNNPSLKQAASAAHIYGKPLCQAEAYTCFAEDWTENPWNMKDIGDAAFCEGLTRQVLCFWVHQPKLDAKPGFQWAHVGTHFDCHITWWPLADGWLKYLARCQHLLRQGMFVADFACLQSEAIPAFISSPKLNESATRPGQYLGVPAGFNYDALNAEVLLTRAMAKDGRLVLPDGMSYRYLVLPSKAGAILTPTTLKKINELADAGVPVIGPQAFAGSVPKMREGTMDSVAKADRFAPDLEIRHAGTGGGLHWIHRRAGNTDIYFVSNQTTNDVTADVVFRTAGKRPERWDAVTGAIRLLPEFKAMDDGRTVVPLKFAPRQSWFVVFRKKVGEAGEVHGSVVGGKNFSELKQVQELTGAWDVTFDPKWGGPTNAVVFNELTDWTDQSDSAIKYYSGIAVYRKVFNLPEPRTLNPFFLNLGVVHDLARVRLNGKDLGVVWTAPWQVEIPEKLLKEKGNELVIEVANLWPNRLMGDAMLPKEKRRTVTNATVYDKKYADAQKVGKPLPLFPSGLLGPVRLMREEQ
jgi:alpha-L-rhamnosidase